MHLVKTREGTPTTLGFARPQYVVVQDCGDLGVPAFRLSRVWILQKMSSGTYTPHDAPAVPKRCPRCL